MSDIIFIKHGEKEYAVMTTRMRSAVLMGSDFEKAGKFLEEMQGKVIIANNQYYHILLTMFKENEGEMMGIE